MGASSQCRNMSTATSGATGYINIPPVLRSADLCCATVLRSVALSYKSGEKVLRGDRNRSVMCVAQHGPGLSKDKEVEK